MIQNGLIINEMFYKLHYVELNQIQKYTTQNEKKMPEMQRHVKEKINS